MTADYYEILGVKRNADDADIRTAYRKLARRYHPDRNPGDKEAEAQFKEINGVFEVLSDRDRREAYDRSAVEISACQMVTEQKPASGTSRQEPTAGSGLLGSFIKIGWNIGLLTGVVGYLAAGWPVHRAMGVGALAGLGLFGLFGMFAPNRVLRSPQIASAIGTSNPYVARVVALIALIVAISVIGDFLR